MGVCEAWSELRSETQLVTTQDQIVAHLIEIAACCSEVADAVARGNALDGLGDALIADLEGACFRAAARSRLLAEWARGARS